MKRVKKGFGMELPRDTHIAVAVTVRECNDWLRLTQRVTRSDGSAHTDAVDLSPEQCEALGITDALEDMPEPWERVRDALTQAWREARGCDVGPFPVTRLPEDDLALVCGRVAFLLGIKPETVLRVTKVDRVAREITLDVEPMEES